MDTRQQMTTFQFTASLRAQTRLECSFSRHRWPLRNQLRTLSLPKGYVLLMNEYTTSLLCIEVCCSQLQILETKVYFFKYELKI